MGFYVPVGFRGGLLRLGTFLLGLMGAMTYHRHHRRRVRAADRAGKSTPVG